MLEQEAQTIADGELPVDSSEGGQGRRKKEQKVNWKMVQKWTVTHSSYDNMGGLLFSQGFHCPSPLSAMGPEGIIHGSYIDA